jgi:Tol biopolymer transport system component
MIGSTRTTSVPSVGLVATLALIALGAFAQPAAAQYFGRNKVQYDDFSFRVLKTPHFDIHFYPAEERAVQQVARMAERWYERFARMFQHEFETSKPLILYADHPDFQQTNTLEGFIGEGTGGVTESLKNRVIMPLAGSTASTNHVLGHELVHAFQFNIAQSRRGGGAQGLNSLPLWLVEGMAEYLSVGRQDPHTAMWLRDAIVEDDFPTIEDLTTESRYFPYRFGQALWAYIGGTYGDDSVVEVYRRALRIGFSPAINQVLGINPDTLSSEWRQRVEQTYGPLMADRVAAKDVGRLLLSPATGAGRQNLSPILSPDGRYVAFLSEKDLFTVDLFLADAQTGNVIRKLTSASADPHFDALAYTETSGSFSPDGSRFAFVVFASGENELAIVETDGDVEQTVKTPGIGSINNPAWSPDGRYIAFSGTIGGISDLFLFDLEANQVRQLTNDEYADFHPAWSPDGRTLAFASDRGPQTDFEHITASDLQLALLDVDTRQVRVLDVFGNVRHSNPQYAPDGRSLYFLSDQDGFSDIYRLELANGKTERITRVKTGVSGITSHSPALSVASKSGDLAFSVFTDFEFHVYTLPANPAATMVSRASDASDQPGRLLPPPHPDRVSRVADYLADAKTGLQPAEAFPVTDATAYRPSLSLDYVGQPSFGVGADRFGNYIGGGASAYFSDMLGDRLLGVAIQAQGTLKDIGGQAFYANLSNRWNWAVAGGHIPYLLMYQTFDRTPPTPDRPQGQLYLGLQRLRVFVTSAEGQLAYPFSSTRRVEFGGGAVRYAYDVEEDRYYLDSSGRFFTGEQERTSIDLPCDELTEAQRLLGAPCAPDPLQLAQGSAAYVGDNAFFGFTSPIRGGRFRFGLEGTVGTENFVTAIADWRRYYSPHRNLTVAVRGLHMGRYGGVESDVIRPLFLGYETFVRGYAYESLEPEECTLSQQQQQPQQGASSCPTFTRLFGHRLGVANIEMRVPFLGVEQFGLINFPYVPVELVAFADAGLAWDPENPALLEFSRSSTERVPVFSVGGSARFNVLGFMILEAYYAVPFQRPEKGPHWGFQIAPGW